MLLASPAVEDVLAIQRLLADYAAAIDGRDFDALGDVFLPDATLDYTSSGGPRDGFPAVRDWLAEALSAVDFTQHLVTNIRVDVDGDEATSSAYFFHPMRAGDATFLVSGTYEDRLARTADGWRIAERVQTMLWSDPPIG